MSESLKDLSLFCVVVHHGGFASASIELGLTPSAVSKAIARLEARLGARLFLRSTRTIKLTEAGAEFFARAGSILDAIDEAEAVVGDIAAAPKGDLYVAASDAFATQTLVPMLHTFHQAYPRIKVHVTQGDGPFDLVKENYDVAIRFEEPNQKGLISMPLIDDPWVICAAPSYLETRSHPDKPSDLLEHRCIAIRARGRLDDKWEFRGGKRNAVTVDPVFSGIGLVAKSAALEGLGIARLARFLVKDDLHQGRLVSLLDRFQIEGQRRIYAESHARGYTPEKVRLFVESLAKYTAASD